MTCPCSNAGNAEPLRTPRLLPAHGLKWAIRYAPGAVPESGMVFLKGRKGLRKGKKMFLKKYDDLLTVIEKL